MWEHAVELVRVVIVSVAHLCAGSLGSAILLVSFGLRLALMPLTLRMARQARRQQERLAAIGPVLERLRAHHAKDPATLMRETQTLYRAHDIRLFTPTGFASLAIQAPLFMALFAATRRGLGTKVRFWWIAELARPDAVLAWSVACLTSVVIAMSMSNTGSSALPAGVSSLIAAAMGVATLVFLWSASSAVALSVGAGSLASALQHWLLSRDRVTR